MGVFLLALAIRLWFQARVQGTLLDGVLVSDSQTYWDWASRLTGELPRSEGPFFLAPLYPHFLGALREILGDPLAGILRAQAVCGAIAVALLADASRRLSSAWIGLAVGVIAACYAPFVFHDSLILTESPLLLLGVLLLWVSALRSTGDHPVRSGLALGTIVGLMALARATNLAWLAVIVFIPDPSGQLSRRVTRAAVAALVALAVCVPAMIHNHRVSREWIPLTYSLGFNLAAGFGPGANGAYVPPTGAWTMRLPPGQGREGGGEWDGRDYLLASEGRRLSPSESSRHWTGVAFQEMRRDCQFAE